MHRSFNQAVTTEAIWDAGTFTCAAIRKGCAMNCGGLRRSRELEKIEISRLMTDNESADTDHCTPTAQET